jgi:uncharacterized membrane protein
MWSAAGRLAGIAVGLLALVVAAPQAQPRPRAPKVIVLGPPLGGSNSSGMALNQRGDVCGVSGAEGEWRPVLFANGKRTPKVLAVNDSAPSWVTRGINDRGDVVGYSLHGDLGSRPVLWKWKKRPVVLADLGGEGEAHAVNTRGEVVGQSEVLGLGLQAVSWSKSGTVAALPLPAEADPFTSDATAISNSGVCVGWLFIDGAQRGARWPTRVSQPHLLNPLDNDISSLAWAVNKQGIAVGESIVADYSTTRAVSWSSTGTTATALPDYPGRVSTTALGVNDRGDIVGTATMPVGYPVALYWAAGGVPVNLNTLLPAGTGIELSRALSINNKRMILVAGREHGVPKTFLVKL